jgi:hypothetical protein
MLASIACLTAMKPIARLVRQYSWRAFGGAESGANRQPAASAETDAGDAYGRQRAREAMGAYGER